MSSPGTFTVSSFLKSCDQSKSTSSIGLSSKTETTTLKLTRCGSSIFSLKDHIDKNKAFDEFKDLEQKAVMEPLGSTDEASRAINRSKNRYISVLPNDETRVKLHEFPGIDGSDYINGNWVGHGKDDHCFIATQGPLPETMPDFWRMIWENDVPIIVMLTKEIEGGRCKCHQYWPNQTDGAVVYGDFELTLVSQEEDQQSEIITRKLKIVHKAHLEAAELSGETDTSRTIIHYQYKGWPDHDVPRDSKAIRFLVEKIRGKKPIVVHCSAGVGRTGTFCVIAIMIERVRKYYKKMNEETPALKFNIYKLVEELRHQRGGMVQQPEQLKFCYEVIEESCSVMGFSLDENEKRHKIQRKQRQMELLHSSPAHLERQSDDSELQEPYSDDAHHSASELTTPVKGHIKGQSSATDLAVLQHHSLSSTLSPVPEDMENPMMQIDDDYTTAHITPAAITISKATSPRTSGNSMENHHHSSNSHHLATSENKHSRRRSSIQQQAANLVGSLSNSVNDRSKLRSTISLAVPSNHHDLDMDDTEEEKTTHTSFSSTPSMSTHKGKSSSSSSSSSNGSNSARKMLVRSMSNVTHKSTTNIADVETHHQVNGGGHRQHTKHGSLTMSNRSTSLHSYETPNLHQQDQHLAPPTRTKTPPYEDSHSNDSKDHNSEDGSTTTSLTLKTSTNKVKRRGSSHSEHSSPNLEQHQSSSSSSLTTSTSSTGSGEKRSKKRSLTSINKKQSSSTRLSSELSNNVDNELSHSTDQLTLSPSSNNNSSNSLNSSSNNLTRSSKSTKRSESHTTASRTKKLNTSQSMSLTKSSEQD